MNPRLTRTIDVFLEGTSKPLIVILGPTAAGKTSASIEIAKSVSGGVVNADSRQIYRYLDIGTAKVIVDETSLRQGFGWQVQGVPHHLLSVKDPKEEVTVGWYQEEALKVIENILERRKVPLLVGGSMLYLSSIIDGLSLAPAADPALRKHLEQEYDRDGGVALYKRLQSIDPDAASAIHPQNKSYVVRALEIYETLKLPKSMSVKEHKSPYDLLILGVTRPRSELLKRIEERIEEMFTRGWIEEVRDLLARGYTPEDPGMRSLGYREICQYLKEVEGSEGSEDIEVAKERLRQRIVAKTRQYAKRQMSWWRNDPRIRWMSLGT